jgi:hypothetical protein
MENWWKHIFESRVARWFAFKPKIAIWVNFGGPCVCRLENVEILYGHLEYLLNIWDF